MYGTDLPERFTEPDFRNMNMDDTIPSDIDPTTISYVGGLFSDPLAFFLTRALQ